MSEEAELELPTVRSEPSDNLEDYLQFIYGAEKIGKTAMCSMFPDTIFFLCEPGGKGLSLFKIDIPDWVTFKKARRLLEKTKRFKNVVVDTGDIAWKYCEEYITKKLGISHISDEDWGKGYAMVRSEFQLECSRLMKLGRGVIFISHTVEKELKKKGGASRHRTVPTLPNQARAVLEPMVDIWAHFQYDDEGNRIMRMTGDQDLAAGHRIGDRHFIGIDVIPMGKSPAEAYKNYIDAFNNKLPGGGPDTPSEVVKKEVVKVVRTTNVVKRRK